jgi:mannitol-specific phosphotransferase system IIBC component
MVPINYLAVLVAAILSMILGYIWYGPLFGKLWMRLMGFTKESMSEGKSKMAKTYSIMFIGTLLMSFTLAHSIVFASAYMNSAGVDAGLTAGIWNWLGFVVPVSLGSVLWDGKPWKLWFINAGYYLVALLMMGVLLAVWAR